VNAFVFTGLWLVIGAVVAWSPVPGALGIGGGFFVAWLMLFFAILAVAGGTLTLAALNGVFPPHGTRAERRRQPARTTERVPERPRATSTLWAPDAGASHEQPGRPSTRRDG
jgi:hypothetical protein